MVISCSAYGCQNRFNRNRPDIHFHKFPLSRLEICQKWISAVRRKSWQPTKSSFLCSSHFDPDDYEPTLLGQLRIRLKLDAVPSKFDFLPHLNKPAKKQSVLKCNTIQPFEMKTNETQENSSSSEEEQEEEYAFPMPTAARTTVPFVERYDLLNHRQPTLKSDPKSLSPHLTAKRQRHNPTSKKILHQVPENTTSLSEQTSEPDEFAHFGNNVAHQLRSMPLEKALLCQIEITKVLSKYKFDVDHQHLNPSQDMLSPPIEASTQHFKREKS